MFIRIAIDVASLGEYGLKPAEGGILLWMDPTPTVRRAAPVAGTNETEPAPWAPPQQAEPSPPQSEGRGINGLIVMAGLAALAGLIVRKVRKDGVSENADRSIQLAKDWLAGVRDAAMKRPHSRPDRAAADHEKGMETDPA